MFRGRFQLGEEVPLAVQCVNAAGTPSAPTAAPVAKVWSTAALVKTFAVPALNRPAVTGLFGTRMFLGADFAAGLYQVAYLYAVGGFTNVEEQRFEILPGGNSDGAAVSMYGFRLPFANYLVHQLDSGKIKKGKNPRV